MKVLQLGPYPPPHGGVQTHIAALRQLLQQQQVSCTVINLTRYRRASSDDVLYPNNGFEVLWLLLRRHYDILHLHIGGRIWSRQLALALLCSLLPGRKSVLTFHSGGYPSSKEGISAHRYTLRAFTFRRFDRIIAVNSEISVFFQRLGVRPERIRQISPWAIPVNGQGASQPLDARLEAFFRDHQPLLITVGLLEKEYDLPLQIAVLGKVREQSPNAGLLIIGSGSLHDPLHKDIDQRSYADHILLYGDLSHSATLEAIRRSDLMLRTTWYDGDALSVREALHFGIPVIASDNGMRPEGVRLIPARDRNALEAAIQELLSRPRPQKSVAKADDPGNLCAVFELYQELIG